MKKTRLKTFHVVWEIDIDANTPRRAARKALQIQRDAGSTATVFDVTQHDTDTTVRVDLEEDSDDEGR